MIRRIGYEFSNGEKRHYLEGSAEEQSAEYCKKENTRVVRVFDGGLPCFAQVGQKRGDNNIEGWNPALGEYVTSKTHYKRLCKEKGLTPVGNEKLKTKDLTKEDKYFTDSAIKEIKNMGADVSDSEIDSLKEI